MVWLARMGNGGCGIGRPYYQPYGSSRRVPGRSTADTDAEARPDIRQQRQQLMGSAGVIKADWKGGNMPDADKISGDVVWSDAAQAGYIRLNGLPMNDKAKETYQLWIYDETQDKKTPIDGGVFDITSEGEVIIPIDAKLKARNPSTFAITVEKPGGVVVSKAEKVAALAPVKPNQV